MTREWIIEAARSVLQEFVDAGPDVGPQEIDSSDVLPLAEAIAGRAMAGTAAE